MSVGYTDRSHNPAATQSKQMIEHLSELKNTLLSLGQVRLIQWHTARLVRKPREWLIQLEMNREMMHRYILVQF